MNKEFVTYEQAMALKELGFDERCFTRYYESGKLADGLSYLHHNYFGQVNAPLYQQAFRWFREKYNLHILINVKDGIWYFERFSINGFNTYEEAESACLDKLIETVKNK